MRVWGLCAVLALASCSEAEGSPEPGAGGSGGTGVSGTGGPGAGGSGAGGSAASGGVAGTSGGPAGTGGGVTTDPVALPPGSREVDGVVNLVDAVAAAQLEQFLLDASLTFEPLRQGLLGPFNLFVDHYVEEYDFVLFVTDHVVENVTLAGRFEAVNRPAVPGGTQEIDIALGGYKTTGRVKGLIGIPYFPDYFPPFSHEIAHYWAAFLDPSFGFGVSLDGDHGPHWGLSSVNGQLGGFDPATLRCETPAAALPPDCTPVASGRTRYVVGDFAPHAAGARPYGPLELYLMGLLPAAEVPAFFQVFTEGQILTDTYDPGANTIVVEASGIATVPFADIVARHGSVTPLPETERHFRAAFIVVSAEPAPDQVMADVARWAGVLGNRVAVAGWPSFEIDTGGRATLDTQLGRRRDRSEPAPPARERFACDVLAQDCGRPELACYFWPPAICVLSGGVQLGEPCSATFACAPGLACLGNVDAGEYFCMPYCDPDDPASSKSCAALCNADHVTIADETGAHSAVCLP